MTNPKSTENNTPKSAVPAGMVNKTDIKRIAEVTKSSVFADLDGAITSFVTLAR
jgi:hypothetical protein